MKVLIYTYATAYQNKAGGVHNRIERTVLALRQAGIEVDFFNPFSTNVADYDVLHIFKLDPSALAIANNAHLIGVKVVVSTIVTLEKGWLVNMYWHMRKFPFSTIYKQIFKICELSSCLIVETPAEGIFLQRYYHVPMRKIKIIPNGTDDLIVNDDIIFDKIGARKEFALVVSRFDNNKNQINLIKALKKTDINVVFIGGPDADHVQYYKACQKEAADSSNIYFLGWLDCDSLLLKSAYTYAKAIVCPSYHETFGLSIVEGIFAGAFPVLSKNLPILGFDVMKNCATFNPHDVADIRKSVSKVMKCDEKFPDKEKVKSFFSWKHVAECHINAYGGKK